jgi:hypothetical protein
MAWWNALTEEQRAYWLREAKTAIPAEGWAAYKRTAIRDRPGGRMMSDRSLDDLFPIPPVPGLGYVCSSCGNPAPCDSEHLVGSPDRDDATIPPDEKLMRLLCDDCLAIEKLRQG